MISIITPTFNRAHLIEKCISSVQNQTFKDWEHLIIDDHSKDNTRELINSLALEDNRIKYLINPKKGAPSARNYGIQIAQGDFLLFLDSDDEITEDKLFKHLESFHSAPLDVSVSKVIRVKNEVITKIDNIRHRKDVLLEFVRKDVTWKIHAPIWRKNFIIDQNIWFEESLKNSQDYQFYCYLIANQPKISYVDNYLSIINDYSREKDPNKIRGRSKIDGLQNHLASRNFVKKYIFKKDMKFFRKIKFRIYFVRHKISVYRNLIKFKCKDVLILSFRRLKTR